MQIRWWIHARPLRPEPHHFPRLHNSCRSGLAPFHRIFSKGGMTEISGTDRISHVRKGIACRLLVCRRVDGTGGPFNVRRSKNFYLELTPALQNEDYILKLQSAQWHATSYTQPLVAVYNMASISYSRLSSMCCICFCFPLYQMPDQEDSLYSLSKSSEVIYS